MEEEDDMHICLVCQQTITGLMNYVNHKKNECSGKKPSAAGSQQAKTTTSTSRVSVASSANIQSEINNVISNLGNLNNLNPMDNFYKHYSTEHTNSQPTIIETEVPPGLAYDSIFSSPETGVQNKAKVVNLQETSNFRSYGSYNSDPSLLENNNDIGDIIPSSQDTGADQEASEKVDDFFLSLELRSKFAPQGEKNAPNLPISNILSNLTFSSDEEDLGFSFADDVSIDSLSDDTDDNAPPRHHTGGKWKPGQGPGPKSVQLKKRLASRGKWPPGESVTNKVASKKYKRQTKGGKWKPGMAEDPKKAKIYNCNFCNLTFSNRFMYSSHCGSTEHKEHVFGQNKPVQSFARGGKAKSISMITRSKAMQYDSDTTEDYENEVDEQILPAEEESTEKQRSMERKNKETEAESGKVAAQNQKSFEERETAKGASEIAKEKDQTNTPTFHPEATLQQFLTATQQPQMASHICTICDKKYNNKYVLSRHLLTKFHRNRSKDHPAAAPLLQKYHKYIVRLSPYQCLICRYFFNKNEFFEDHVKSEEHANNCADLVGEIKCSICSFKTHLNEAIVEHIDSDEHKKNVSKCNKLCVIKESHVQCKCKYCGLVVRAFSRLKRHIILKHPNKEITSPAVKRKLGVHNRPRCEICQKKCHSESALKIHIRRRHTKERPFECTVCGKSFADRGSRDLHYKSQKHAQKILEQQYAISGKEEDKVSFKSENKDDKINIKEEENEEYVQSIVDDVAHNVLSTLENTFENEVESVWPKEKKPRGRPKKRLMHDDYEDLGDGVKRKRRSTNKIKCKHCDVTVANYNDLRPHYMKEHSTQVRLCELCDMIFLSARSLRLHYLSRVHQKNMNQTEGSVDDTKFYKCPICLKKFVDQKYCKFHTEYQHNHLNSEDQILKKFNGQDVTRLRYKEYLLKVESLDRTASVQCPECNKDLKKNNLMDHLRMHTGDKVFVCRLCHRGFISSVTLRRHLLGHFGCQDCTCEICGKSYKKQSTLEQHLTIHQMEKAGEQKMHICDVCGQSFYFEHQLLQHSRRHQDRKFKCTFPGCHWKFVFKNELSYHLRSHSQEKPYLCDICGYAASTKIRLQRHNVTHTGERKYHCEYCTYKAGNSTHLHRHMRIHIGSKPYKCPYCDYSCNTHENIRKHIAKTKKHEGMKIYPCKLCDFGTNSSKDFRNHLFECHEFEVEERNLDALSSFTGLYSKQEDPKKPAEGMQVIQVKEKQPRNASNQQRKKRTKIKETNDVQDDEQESIAKAMLYFSQDHANMLRPDEYGIENQTTVFTRVTDGDGRKYSIEEYQAVTPTEEINQISLPDTVQGQEQIDEMNHYRNVAIEYQPPESPGSGHRINKQTMKPRAETKRDADYEILKSKHETLVQIIQQKPQIFESERTLTAGKLDTDQTEPKLFTPMMSMPGSMAVMLTPVVRPFGSFHSNQDTMYQPHALIDEQTSKPLQFPVSTTLTQQLAYTPNITYNTSVFQQPSSPSQQSQHNILQLSRGQEGNQLKSVHDDQKGQSQGHRETRQEARSLLHRSNFKYNNEDFAFKETRRQEHENGDGSLVIDMSTYIPNA